MEELKWQYDGKASRWWYLLGFLGIGNLIALIYVLLSNSKNRVWALFYLLGIFGDIILYLVFRVIDNKLADLSMKLFIGQLVSLLLVIIVFIFFAYVPLTPTVIPIASNASLGTQNKTIAMISGFNGLVIGANCNSSGMMFTLLNPYFYNITIKNLTVLSINRNVTISNASQKVVFPSYPNSNPKIQAGGIGIFGTGSLTCIPNSKYSISLGISYIFQNSSGIYSGYTEGLIVGNST